ncbi:MAG: CinA family protein [Pirellulaceae bacterium]
MSDRQSPESTLELEELARIVASCLAETGQRLVLAESCTGGLAAAALATIPGISRWFCGSAVTYRDQTKIDWLEVAVSDLARVSAVSREIAGQMASGVLGRTSEADVAASITGHLGPDAPPDSDGTVWVGTAYRTRGVISEPTVLHHTLVQTARIPRQREAAVLLLRQAVRQIRNLV